MKIESTHISSITLYGFDFELGTIRDLTKEQAEKALKDFPTWFKAVELEKKPIKKVTKAEPKASIKKEK